MQRKNNFTPAPGGHDREDREHLASGAGFQRSRTLLSGGDGRQPEERFTLRISAGRTAAEVVLLKGKKIVAQRTLTADRTLAMQLLLAIEELCAAEKIDLADIAKIDFQSEAGDDSSASRTAKVVADMLVESQGG